MSAGTILVVDDEEKIRTLLRRALEMEGYCVIEAHDATSALDALANTPPSLITLDLNLGSDNGLDLARHVRKDSDVPIIMLTGQGDVIDRVTGLEIGADDYLTKPFHVRELIARVRTVMRRYRQAHATKPSTPAIAAATSDPDLFEIDGLRVNLGNFEFIDRDGRPGALTTADFRLLGAFLRNPDKVLSRDMLMDLVAGHGWVPLDRTIDNQIARLRKKIERDPANPVLIKTVRGVGYIFAS